MDVPSRNVKVQYDLGKLEQQEIEATRAVYDALDIVYKWQNNTHSLRILVANVTMKLAEAESISVKTHKKVEKLIGLKQLAEELHIKAEEIVKNVTNRFELSFTNLQNAQRGASDSLSFAQSAYNTFK